jgi:predicted transglutaminase-like cysteine proteinase
MRIAGVFAFAFLAVISSKESSAAASMLEATRSIGAPVGFVSACHRYSWLCSASSGREMSDAEALPLLKRINGHVNATVTSADDLSVYGKQDFWSLPTGGRGDCEDYALQKKKDLIDAGFRSDRLAMTVVLDSNGRNHAVLLARLKDGDYVLDNLTGGVRSWESTGYTFLARQSFENQRVWKVILAGPRAHQFQGS